MDVQYIVNGQWVSVQNLTTVPEKCSPNDVNTLKFNPVTTQQVRVVFQRDVSNDHYVGVTELEIWAPWPQGADVNVYEAEDGLVVGAEVTNSV